MTRVAIERLALIAGVYLLLMAATLATFTDVSLVVTLFLVVLAFGAMAGAIASAHKDMKDNEWW